MRQPSPIADYAAALARELAFDVSLSRRVRQEVEDHLWEAVAELRFRCFCLLLFSFRGRRLQERQPASLA